MPTQAHPQPGPVHNHVDLWQKALYTLDESVKKNLSYNKHNKSKMVGIAIKVAQEKKELCIERQWKYTRTNGKVIILRDVVEKIIAWLEKFKTIGDPAMQYDVLHAALPWAAVRFVAVSDKYVFAATLEGLETCSHLITRYATFEAVHLTRLSAVRAELEDKLIELYTEILCYLAKARQYFGSSVKGRFLEVTRRPDEDSQMQKILDHEDQITNLTKWITAGTQRDKQTDVWKELKFLQSLEVPINRLNQQTDVIYREVKEEEYAGMLRWVSTVPYSRHHERISENRVYGTGEWLLAHPNYLQWKSSSSSGLLLLQGIMGSGKTSLTSKVIDSFLSEKQAKSALFGYFYCANNVSEPERADPSHILRSLLQQMTFVGDSARSVRETLMIEYQKRKAEVKVDGFEMSQLSIDDCTKMLLDIMWSNPAVIVIDAIDEVEEARRNELVYSLNRIAAQASSIVKIILTSRFSNDLTLQINDPTVITVNRSDSRSDMELFVRQRLDSAIENKRLLGGQVSDSFQIYLADRLVNAASDMFSWVDLQIEKLCRIRLEADVKSAAEDVSTRSVHEIYAEIYNSTDNEGPAVRKVVKRAISWLLCSYEALTPALFLSAISSAEHGRIGDITDTASLTTICGGLVIIDTKMDVVRFVHRSLQEFLAARDEFTVSECHRVVAETCLSMCIHGPDMELATEACGKADLYKYCTLYWPRHCHCAELEGSVEALTKKMKEFVFDGDDTSLIFVEWLKQAKEFSKTLPPYHELERPEDAAFKAAGPPFFLACAFGLMSIVDHFGAQKNMDYNIRNSLGHTGIYLAGAHGHTAIVQYLLDHGAEPRPSGGSFGSPLYAAAFKGHIEVVKILLKPYAGEVYDKICDTAIEAALTGSQELIALTVLEKRSPFENKEEYDIFILRAVQAGFVHVVDHLRNNTKYERGFSTPPAKARLINSAILKGSFTVLRPLLSPAQNHAVGLQLELPRGAMSVASLDGHLDIIMLLLNHNVDLEQEGPYGRPLRVASLMGHESVVRVLLDHGADANVGGPHGDALQAAAMQGHLTITRMLLRKGAKIGRAGGIFGNALEAAAVRGHRSVAEELLKSGTFDPEYLKYEIFEESFNAAVVVGQENIIRSFSEVKMDRPWWMYDDPPFVPPRENKDLIRAASPKKGPTSNVNAFESYQKEDMKPAIARTLDAPLPASVWETSYPSIDRFQQIFLERNNEDRVEDETNSITKSEALLMDRLRKIPPLVGAALRNSKSIVSFLIQSDNKTKNDVNVEVLGNAVLTALENGNMEIVRLLLNQNFVDSEAVIRLLRELVSHGDRMVVELLLKNIDGSECPSHRYQDFALYRRRNRLKPTSPSPDRVYHFALIEVLQVSCEVGQISVIELAVDLMNKDKWFNEHQTVKYPLLRSAFETACANNQCHVLPVLSEYISDLKPSSLQCRAFQRASIRGGCESIRSLYRILSILAKYVLPPAGSYLHYRALRTAAEKGHHGTVQFLVETYSSELSLKAYEDAVLAASGNGHAETLRWLIYKVKEIRSSQSLLDTAFHLAVSNGRVEVVGILIREIADINATVRTFVDFDDDYRHHRRGYGSPYHSTARPKASSPLQAVLSSFTIRGLPLQLMFQYRCWEPASQCDKEATVRVLLDHDADIWSLGGFPRTPLQQAVQFVSLDVVRLILARVSHLDDALVHKLLCSATVRELLTGTILHELLEHFGTVRSNNMDLSQPLANALAFFDTCRDHESAKGIGRFIRSESINDVLSTGPGAAIKILLPKCPDAEVNDARYGLLLQMATVKGDIKYVKLLLERGLDPNWEGGYYHTSLQAAARMGHTDIVKLLIAAGADPNKAGGSHSTPLWAAVQYQRGEMVKLLIAHGADANPPASYWPHARTYYPSLVQMAIAMDDMSIVKSLIDRGAHINPAPSERHSHFPAIIEACHRGNPAMVRLLLTYGADPRILGPMKPHVIPHYYPAVEKTSALHMACKMGHQEVVQELLAYGVDLESSDIDFGTPLCAAAFGGHISVMEILLEAGANTDESVNGSALWYAASRGHSQIVEKLLAMGVTLGIRSSSRNALKEASFWWFRKDIIQILLDSVQGSPEEIAACEDALASACARKNDDALKLLLDYGAPPFPGLLHRACRFGLAKSVETLLDMSMASNEVDEEGNSPLQVAIADGQHHIASLLMERGVKNDEDNAKYGAPVIVVEEVVVGKEC